MPNIPWPSWTLSPQSPNTAADIAMPSELNPFETFKRNLHQSFCALRFPAVQEGAAPYQSVDWNEVDMDNLQAPCLFPFTAPQLDGVKMACRVILRMKDKSYRTIMAGMTWRNDLPTDLSIMEPNMPRMGTIQVGEYAVFLRRTPVRHYTRGYAPRYTSMSIFNPRAHLAGYGLLPQASNYDVVWNVFNPTFYTYSDAMTKLEAGDCLSAAIAPLLCIGVDEGRKNPLVVFRDEIIGRVEDGDILVESDTSEFRKDYIFKVTGVTPKVME